MRLMKIVQQSIMQIQNPNPYYNLVHRLPPGLLWHNATRVYNAPSPKDVEEGLAVDAAGLFVRLSRLSRQLSNDLAA